jgi:hypothetical protein
MLPDYKSIFLDEGKNYLLLSEDQMKQFQNNSNPLILKSIRAFL